MNNITPVKKSAERILVWCCVLALTVVFVQSVRAAPPSGTNWGLLYADEFGGSSVDTQKWITEYPWGQTHDAGNSAYMLPRNLSVANGVLTETAKRETAPDGKAFTSGTISTGYNFLNYTYGYAEARIKLPSRLGSFPAFWGLYNGWPPEADIMEYPIFTSGMNYNKYNIAYHYTNSSGDHASSGGWVNPGGVGDITTDFHTFGFEWSATALKYYFDGTVMRTFTNATEIADLVDAYILLTNGWGSWPGMPGLGG